MFCRDGIHATGVDRILAAAGASKMTLYARFGSKEALVREALRREGETWRAAFFEEVRGASDDPGERLRAVVPALAGWFRGGRFYGCAFINAAAEHTKGEPWVRELALEHGGACRTALRELAAAADAVVPDDLAAEIALLVDGTITGLMVSGNEAVLRTAARVLDGMLRDALPAPLPRPRAG